MSKEIIIKRSTIKLVLSTIVSLLFLIVGIYVLYDVEILSMKEIAIFISVIILSTIAFLTFIYRLFFRSHIPVLIVNEEGYIYLTKYFVWWGQVKDIQLLTVHQYYGIQRFIEVKLENIKTIPIAYEKYNFKVVSYTQHSKKTSKYITMGFGVASGTFKTKKVIEIMKEYKAEYDRIHKATKLNNDV